MTSPQVAPYGTWPSPISADLVTAKTLPLDQVVLDGSDIYWGEGRPTEGGRITIMQWAQNGAHEQPVLQEILSAPYNARTRVHEYGGGSFTVMDGTVYFANFADQAVYRMNPGGEPQPVHSHPGMRFADFAPDRVRQRLIAVCEDHTAGGSQPENRLVALGVQGGQVAVLASGHDFYSSPCVSPDGNRLAWLTWNHPNMPWDGTELWLGSIGPDGHITGAHVVAGGPTESIFQPSWSPDGTLYFVSDRTGWWNLYRLENRETVAVSPMDAEFGRAQWRFGSSTYAFAGPLRIICAYASQGTWHLGSIDTTSRTLTPVEAGYTEVAAVVGSARHVVLIAGSPADPDAVVRLDPATGERTVLRQSIEIPFGPGYLSPVRPVAFPTQGGLTAYGLFYPPTNRDFVAPAGERPPLIVLSHGGPTSAARSTLNLNIQYWTSRGFAILDVNYGGSTGYGRSYRERLKPNWGIVDVDDCANGALHLVREGLVDGDRLIIRGGSAGGYTTLAALTFRNVFRVGVSLYGISDLETVAADTHKFESRYEDGLVGPYPEARETYRSRSPIHFVDRLSCPLILFQGLDDHVVPPSQAEAMVAAVTAKGLPVAYLPFEGEGHGFRRAENNRRVLEAQLYFFGRVFGFTPADPVEPVAITNI